MARILFGWELGGNYGHVARFVPTARELIARGHEIVMVLRNPRSAAGLVDDLPIRVYGAPMVHQARPGLHVRSWTHILEWAGLRETAGLRMALVAWRELIGLLAPDLIVTDSAPVLQLATLDRAVPRVTHDSPWGAAADRHPQPEVGLDKQLPLTALRGIDEEALDLLNAAAQPLGLPELTEVRQLYRSDAHLVCAFPELDPFADEHDWTHLGNTFVTDRGERYDWPPGDGPRVFAYLRRNRRLLEELTAIADTGCPTILVCPNMPDNPPPLPSTVALHRRAARLDHLIQSTDLAVTASATGTGAAFLLGGVPLLLLPNYVEQGLIAECVAKLGAGRVVHPPRAPGQPPPEIRPHLDAALRKRRYRRGAQRFAARHAGFRPAHAGRRAADAIEQVLAARAQ